jgi:cation diffusion facilitator CzcD-associated flavoprotein CzcO
VSDAVRSEAGQSGEVVDAVVVGAGFAGLYMLYRLRADGLRVRVLEAGDGVGGTWYWNRYPGARCDVPSMDYSYSFSEELQQEWRWSERFASQAEILRYLNHVADRFDLRRDIRLRTRVKAAAYAEGSSQWQVTAEDGYTVRARFLVMASGNLSAAKRPEICGIDSFRGPAYHTGNWPREGADFTGQRVAVIGTGSSGVQCIPLIAAEAASVTVFQRTPNFSVPAHNRPLSDAEVAERKSVYAEHREKARHSQSGTPPFDVGGLRGHDVDPGVRERTWQRAWDEGNAIGLIRAYSDTMTDPVTNGALAEFVGKQVASIVADQRVAARLISGEYPIGAKRLCLDTGYFATFNRGNVELVDLRKEPIREIIPSGIRTADREREFDAMVFATGFDAMTGALDAVSITGRDGRTLREEWSGGPQTYLGLAVTGFPNLFLVTGPGSPSVLSNVVVSIEQHVEWICSCVAFLREHGYRGIEASTQSQASWTQHVQEVAEGTLFVKANSWYLGANVPGKPRVFMPYLGGVGHYRDVCDDVASAGYNGFTLT